MMPSGLFSWCVCDGGGVCTYMFHDVFGRSEVNMGQLVFSFYYMGPGVKFRSSVLVISIFTSELSQQPSKTQHCCVQCI